MKMTTITIPTIVIFGAMFVITILYLYLDLAFATRSEKQWPKISKLYHILRKVTPVMIISWVITIIL